MKKTLSFLLIIIMMLSTPLTVYADTIGGDVGGGGTGNMDSSIQDYKAWSFRYQGYRFYIINNSFERVTDVYDYLFTTPIEIGYQCYDTRFDGPNSPNGKKVNTIADLANLTDSTSDEIPAPVRNNKGYGETFKEWFLKNIPYSGGGITITSGTSKKSVSGIVGVITEIVEEKKEEAPTEPEIPDYVYSTIFDGKTITSNFEYEYSQTCRRISIQEKQGALEHINNCNVFYTVAYNSCKAAYPYVTEAEAEYYAIARVSAILDSYKLTPLQKKFLCLFTYRNRELSYMVANKQPYGSLLQQNIPLSGGRTESVEGCPAQIFLTDSYAIKVPNYDSALDALADGHFLVVEPICWLYVPSNDINYPEKGKRTYGSYWNLAKKWVEQGGRDSGNFYASYMTELGNNCMVVNSDIENEEGNVIKAATIKKRTISESLAAMETSGLAMHLYSGDMLKKDISIIKNYVDETGEVEGNEVESITTSELNIMDETDHMVVKWETSEMEEEFNIGYHDDWETIIENSTHERVGEGAATISLNDNEKVVFIQLQRKEKVALSSDWVLEESEISKVFTTGEDSSSKNIAYKYGCLNNCVGHDYCGHYCNGNCCSRISCSHSCGDACEDGCIHSCGSGCRYYYCGHSCNNDCETAYCDFEFVDKSYSFKLKNENEAKSKNLIAKSDSFEVKNNTINKERGSLNNGTLNVSGFIYDFVLHRGDDKLSLASYINTDDTLEEIGYNSTSSKGSKTRLSADYQKSLKISLVDNSSDLNTSSKGDSGHGKCTNSDTASTSDKISVEKLVTIRTYSGVEMPVHDYINKNRKGMTLTSRANDMTAGKQILSGAVIRFNPYIRMTYTEIQGNKKSVYVLGEYERTIIPNDYAEIEWMYKEENMKIDSTMFAHDLVLTDKNDDKDWTDRGQVLKGGSSFTLTVKNQRVFLNTYQTILGDTSRGISEITGTYELSEKEAKEEHRKFVDQAITTYENTEVIQYVNNDVEAEYAWSGDGIKVYSGADISKLKNGSSKTSTDMKYYFAKDSSKNLSSEGDLDVNEIGTTKEYYRFYADTSGNIYMVEGNSVDAVENSVGTVVLTKGQGADSLSGQALFLDKRTQAVTKLIAALERNSGNDMTASWVSDGKWYNEAYDGVIIVVQMTELEIGFQYPSIRGLVLDPKLCPKLESKSEMGKNAFVTQYKVNISDDSEISTFKGENVYMYKGDLLFNSQRVYIPNMTVDDSSN